jgi:hypothetical protein
VGRKEEELTAVVKWKEKSSNGKVDRKEEE